MDVGSSRRDAVGFAVSSDAAADFTPPGGMRMSVPTRLTLPSRTRGPINPLNGALAWKALTDTRGGNSGSAFRI